MNIQIIAVMLVASLLGGCVASRSDRVAGQASDAADVLERIETTRDATSTASTMEGYKHDLAQRISQVNSTKVYIGRPQALLRSVVVLKYAVDANGNLLRSEIMRSNHDSITEKTALTTLKQASPFPKPAAHLLRRGRVDIIESWLFNSDGRFQLRTIAEPQMDE